MLEQIRGPADLQHLSQSQLSDLADEIRQFLIHKVAATGGHLGPNLGVVELTLALHRVFDSPHDPIIFDTGHQAYVHKMLTGRCHDFDTLRKKDGLSGYPSRAESDHDWVESSHASSALSYADGLAKAFELTGHRNRHVVAVVGDGALTGGMCWEALNNIAAARRPVVIVVNDNGRSYAPTIGGFADHLAALRLQPGYEKLLEEGRKAVRGVPVIGELCYQCMHSIKAGIKDALSPQVMFTDLGAEVRRADRRPRRARGGGRAAQRPRLQRPGDRARRHPQGHGLRARENRRGRADALHGRHRPADRAGHQGPRTGLDVDVLRGADQVRRQAPRHRGDHRRDAGPDGSDRVREAVPRPVVRRRHRRTARDDVGRRVWRWAACIRWWRSIRRS